MVVKSNVLTLDATVLEQMILTLMWSTGQANNSEHNVNT